MAPRNERPTSSAPVEGVPPCRWQTSFTPRLQSRAARQSLRLSQSKPMTGTPRAPHRPPSAMARAVVGGRALVGEPRGAGRHPLSTETTPSTEGTVARKYRPVSPRNAEELPRLRVGGCVAWTSTKNLAGISATARTRTGRGPSGSRRRGTQGRGERADGPAGGSHSDSFLVEPRETNKS